MDLAPTSSVEERNFWKILELRALVLVSLLLQVVLIAIGNRRKYSKNKWVAAILWLSYLSADSVATLALGVLSQTEGDSKSVVTITAFWAPFLLMHLGGPDTITAYAMADNELWLRHLLGLIVQASVVVYVFYRSFTWARLNFISMVIFLVGFVKYGERSWVLFSASKDRYRGSMVSRPDPGPNYAKFMDEKVSRENEGYRVSLTKAIDNLNSSSSSNDPEADADQETLDAFLLEKAYYFFGTFKKLFADLILTFQDREISVSYFKGLKWEDAFSIVEMELGLVFDLFYTKSSLVFSAAGVCLRIFSCSATIAAFVAFHIIKEDGYPETELIITYILLVGAIFLELYAILILFLSDRMMISLGSDWTTLPKAKLPGVVSLFQWLRIVPRRKRWSNSMGQYNVLNHCLNYMPKRAKSHWYPRKLDSTIDKLDRYLVTLDQYLEKYLFWRNKAVPDDLKKLIFDSLKGRATLTGGPEKSESYRRDKILLVEMECFNKSDVVEFDQSLLIWHMATDICYYNNVEQSELGVNAEQSELGINVEQSELGENAEQSELGVNVEQLELGGNAEQSELGPNAEQSELKMKRKRCRLLSDYMVHLLIMSPFMLPSGIGQIRFQDTYAEATEFFKYEKILYRKDACEMLSKVKAAYNPSEVKGDRSKSFFFDAQRLADALNKLEVNQRWDKITQAWVDMLTFAAAQCSWSDHAEKLSRGGELLTHVWLLMAHFGMTDQFQISQGYIRAKLDLK